MKALSQSLIDRARDVPIDKEISRRAIQLKRVSKIERAGPCPACGGTDRFSINTRKQLFNCRGFDDGDVIAMVMHIDACGFTEAVRALTGEQSTYRDRNNSLSRLKRNDENPGYIRQQARKAAWLWNHRQPL